MAEQDFDQSPLAPGPGHKSLLFLLRKRNKQRKGKEEASRRKRGLKERRVEEKPARTMKTAAFGPICHPGHCSGEGRARAHIHFFYSSANID